MIKDWNNQVRSANAALALKAYHELRGERGCDEDGITDLIIDLLNLKKLVSEESIEGLLEYCGSVIIDEESDKDQAGIECESMPEYGDDELRMWERINGSLTREILTAPPSIEATKEGA